MKVYHLRVSIIGIPKVHRVIEATANCTFDDLHDTIFDAFERCDPQRYAFFITKTDTCSLQTIYRAPEVTHSSNLTDQSGAPGMSRSSATTTIGDVGMEEKDVIHYLFDFGDDWWHRIRVQSVGETRGRRKRIRVVKAQGEAPPQYPDDDDDDDWMNDGSDGGGYRRTDS